MLQSRPNQLYTTIAVSKTKKIDELRKNTHKKW